MISLIYFILFLASNFMFYVLFNINFNSYLEIPLGILSILLSLVIAFVLTVGIIAIIYNLRKNKPYDNVFNHYFANSILLLGLRLGRVKLVVTGKENIPKTNFVYYGNHQENWDIIAIKPVFKRIPLNFIAKEALWKVPLLGGLIKMLGNVPISRTADRSAAESIIKGIKIIKSGNPMAIFPEGKRSFGNELIDFKPGAFKLAMKPKADILIGTLYDVSKMLKQWPFKRQVVRLHIHPLLKYEDYKDLNSNELAQLVKDQIQTQLDKFKELS